jgi:hypothetical protein
LTKNLGHAKNYLFPVTNGLNSPILIWLGSEEPIATIAVKEKQDFGFSSGKS